ncbi:MAG: low molecular weight phosphotyrosine protein phosphatase [Campylobacterales bacterium]|nr:low molecular weight phosphotyrosine protein phosphatase [Campylobacterales bacterium]
MKKVLFVCLGNICRSPLAHGIALDLIEKNHLDIEVDSAGTSSWHVGENPCDRSIQVAKKHGIEISKQKARQVQSKDFIYYDLIVALDQSNYNDLQKMGCRNLVKLRFYDGTNQDVPDPYFFKGFDGFEEVFMIIEKCVKNLFFDQLTK